MKKSDEEQPLLQQTEDRDDADDVRSILSFGKRDSDNPQEWSNRYKWFSVGLLCMCAAVVTFTCAGIVPVAGDVVEDLKGEKDRSSAVLFVTIWELGEAAGPLFLAPLSERYGRFRVYNTANCCFILGILATSLSQDMTSLIFARFATGCAVASNVLNPAIIGDMFPSHSRGAAMSAIMLAPLIGGALGPMISGSLAEATQWRAVCWLCLTIATVIEIVFAILFKETYYPILLKRRPVERSKLNGDDIVTRVCVTDHEDAKLTLLQSLSRPGQIFWKSRMLQCMSLWCGFVFAFFYVNSTSLPEILDTRYGFSPAQRGMSYLAWSLGSVISITICNRAMDKVYNKLGERHGSFYPEGRLPFAIVGAFLLPVAIILYGWTAELQVHVSLFLGSVTLMCMAVVMSMIPTMTFITDVYGKYSASAITAVLTTRSVIGAFLPLVVPPLAESVGYGWGFLVLTGLALILAPLPILVMRLGPKWRQRSDYLGDK